jgi:hypothetical protein
MCKPDLPHLKYASIYALSLIIEVTESLLQINKVKKVG